jgi:hypothetical protein
MSRSAAELSSSVENHESRRRTHAQERTSVLPIPTIPKSAASAPGNRAASHGHGVTKPMVEDTEPDSKSRTATGPPHPSPNAPKTRGKAEETSQEPAADGGRHIRQHAALAVLVCDVYAPRKRMGRDSNGFPQRLGRQRLAGPDPTERCSRRCNRGQFRRNSLRLGDRRQGVARTSRDLAAGDSGDRREGPGMSRGSDVGPRASHLAGESARASCGVHDRHVGQRAVGEGGAVRSSTRPPGRPPPTPPPGLTPLPRLSRYVWAWGLFKKITSGHLRREPSQVLWLETLLNSVRNCGQTPQPSMMQSSRRHTSS